MSPRVVFILCSFLFLTSLSLVAPPRTVAQTPDLEVLDWVTDPATGMVNFHLRWHNPDPAQTTAPLSGAMSSQEFGVFMPNAGQIGTFNVPSLAPASSFDVFFDVDVSSLPPTAQEILPGGGPEANSSGGGDPRDSTCAPDDHWDGNVDVDWTGPTGGGNVNVHYGTLQVCPGAGNSYIHVSALLCTDPAGLVWSVADVCPGFTVTLVNEDFTPAPSPLPPGWTGWICVSADASVPLGLECCPRVVFDCAGVPAEITLCATACDWGTQPPEPVPQVVDWVTNAATGRVEFQLRWHNPDPGQASAPVSGVMSSQEFGVFLPDAGQIGTFNVPSLAPDSFFDVFFDVEYSSLPPTAQEMLPGGPAGGSASAGQQDSTCTPDDHWDGNVDVDWTGPNGGGNVNAHYGTLQVCPGAGNSYIHVSSLLCTDPAGLVWSVADVCPGFTVTLVNEDFTPAPAPLPPGWTGWICVSADATVPLGLECCPRVVFDCAGVPAEITLCVTTCDWGTAPPDPVPQVVDWVTNAATGRVEFQLRWHNPDPGQASAPVSGVMSSQEFGVFLPDAGQIGTFNVPSLAPDSFFDVFFDVEYSSLPPTAQEILPGDGSGAEWASGGRPDSACTPDDHWDGNVDVDWTSPQGGGNVNVHYGTLQVCPGAGNSYIHVSSLLCTDPVGLAWSVADVCPGFTVTLVNEDFTPAPSPLPPGWTGWICVSAGAVVPLGFECCPRVVFDCAGVPAEITLCVTTCACGTTGLPDHALGVGLAIRAAPNPTSGTTTLHFTLPEDGTATIEIFDAAGRRVRTLLRGPIEEGTHTVTWYGRGDRGETLSAGVYLMRLRMGGKSAMQKVLLIR